MTDVLANTLYRLEKQAQKSPSDREQALDIVGRMKAGEIIPTPSEQMILIDLIVSDEEEMFDEAELTAIAKRLGMPSRLLVDMINDKNPDYFAPPDIQIG